MVITRERMREVLDECLRDFYGEIQFMPGTGDGQGTVCNSSSVKVSKGNALAWSQRCLVSRYEVLYNVSGSVIDSFGRLDYILGRLVNAPEVAAKVFRTKLSTEIRPVHLRVIPGSSLALPSDEQVRRLEAYIDSTLEKAERNVSAQIFSGRSPCTSQLYTLAIVYSVLKAFSEISDLFLATSSQGEDRLTNRQAYLWDVDISEKVLPSILTMASDYGQPLECGEIQSFSLFPVSETLSGPTYPAQAGSERSHDVMNPATHFFAVVLNPPPTPVSHYDVALGGYATELLKSSESLIADAMGLRNEDRSWPAYSRMVKVHAILIEITNRFSQDFYVNEPASSSKAVTATWL
jgi:hypothetical protein